MYNHLMKVLDWMRPPAQRQEDSAHRSFVAAQWNCAATCISAIANDYYIITQTLSSITSLGGRDGLFVIQMSVFTARWEGARTECSLGPYNSVLGVP